MNVSDHYRATLDLLTLDHQGGVDLSAAITEGRRRRRVRRATWAGAGVAVAVVATLAGVAIGHGSSSAAVDPGVTSSPSAHDFVAGTDIDETVQATVAQHLPSVPSAEDVYPSDWNTPGPIPDAHFADATEWQAVYQVSHVEQLNVLMSRAIPGQPVDVRCDDVQQVDLPCRRSEAADGSLDMEFGTVIGTSTYRFLTLHVAPDGFVTETLDDVQAQSWGEAQGARQVTRPATRSLVQDPALRFPAPVHPPAPPAPQA